MDNTQDANTEGDERGASGEYWVHDDIPGLWITFNPEEVHGQTTVISHGDTDGRSYLVWDSSWDQTRKVAEYTQIVTRNAAHASLGVLTDANEMKQQISVYHSPVKGTPSVTRIHGYGEREKFIQDYAKTHDFKGMSLDEMKKPIPADESVEDADTDDEAEQNELEDDEIERLLQLPKTQPRYEVGPDEVFLYMREYRGGNGKLLLDPSRKEVHLVLLRQNLKTVKTAVIKESSRIQHYPFKKGTAFRLINCHMIQKSEIDGDNNNRVNSEDKLVCAVFPPLPPIKEHPAYDGSESKKYPTWKAKHAKHNADVLPAFIKLLEEIVGTDKVKRCDDREETDVEIVASVAKGRAKKAEGGAKMMGKGKR